MVKEGEYYVDHYFFCRVTSCIFCHKDHGSNTNLKIYYDPDRAAYFYTCPVKNERFYWNGEDEKYPNRFSVKAELTLMGEFQAAENRKALERLRNRRNGR